MPSAQCAEKCIIVDKATASDIDQVCPGLESLKFVGANEFLSLADGEWTIRIAMRGFAIQEQTLKLDQSDCAGYGRPGYNVKSTVCELF
jgi:hypothetical protein